MADCCLEIATRRTNDGMMNQIGNGGFALDQLQRAERASSFPRTVSPVMAIDMNRLPEKTSSIDCPIGLKEDLFPVNARQNSDNLSAQCPPWHHTGLGEGGVHEHRMLA